MCCIVLCCCIVNTGVLGTRLGGIVTLASKESPRRLYGTQHLSAGAARVVGDSIRVGSTCLLTKHERVLSILLGVELVDFGASYEVESINEVRHDDECLDIRRLSRSS